MLFSIRSDRALRLLLYLDAQAPDRHVTMTECGEALADEPTKLKTIVPGLARARIIEAKPGPRGGLRLLRDASTLGVDEIIRAAEDDDALTLARCGGEEPCGCFMAATGHCSIKPMFDALQDKMMRFFESYTLAELRRPANREAARALGVAFVARPGEGG